MQRIVQEEEKCAPGPAGGGKAGSKDSSSLVADFEFHYGAMQWSVVRLTEPISLSETGA